jgi:hypothetical protein
MPPLLLSFPVPLGGTLVALAGDACGVADHGGVRHHAPTFRMNVKTELDLEPDIGTVGAWLGS